MSNLTMPKINISFSTAARSFTTRGDRGAVLQILRDATLGGNSYSLLTGSEAPAGLSADNAQQIANCFLGYVSPPKKMLVYVIDDGDEHTLASALAWAATQQFDYICGPADVSAEEAGAIAAWVKTQRADCNAIFKAVLPNLAADSEAIVNFTASGIKTATATYTAAGYCSRIAGMLAGTPTKISATYAPLPEVTDVDRLTPAEMDAAVGAGKLILWYDGTQVLTGRAVNSMVTTTAVKGDILKKIKHVTVIDHIDSDIRRMIRSEYIGKYPNSYDNKLVLITAIRGYLQTLEGDDILQPGWVLDIDASAQREYLKAAGVDVGDMDDQAVREANTGSEVFLGGTMSPLDAIEDVTLNINL